MQVLRHIFLIERVHNVIDRYIATNSQYQLNNMHDRNLALDILKFLLALMVVSLHGHFLLDFSEAASYLVTNGLFRIAVPIFFIINGFFFSTISEDKDFKKWGKRVLYLYSFWMLFYVYFWFRPESYDLLGALKISSILFFGHEHLWYLTGMLGAGALTYLFRTKTRLGLIVAAVCYVTGVTIQYMGNYHLLSSYRLDALSNMYFTHRNFLFFAYPFFYIGYLFKRYNYTFNVSLTMKVSLLLIGIFTLLSESWFNYTNPNNDGGYDNYFSLLLLCPVLFLVLNQCTIKTKSKILSLISSGIYFIHPFFYAVLRNITTLEATQMTIACIVLSIGAAFFLALANQRIKFNIL